MWRDILPSRELVDMELDKDSPKLSAFDRSCIDVRTISDFPPLKLACIIWFNSINSKVQETSLLFESLSLGKNTKFYR
jgi:hypothetical protein